MNLTKKPELMLQKLWLKTLKPISETWLDQKRTQARKAHFAKRNRLLTKTWPKNRDANFRDLSKFNTKLFEPKTWADFEERKTWEIATAKNAKLYWTRKLAKNQNPDLQDSKRQFENQLNFWNRLKDLLQVLANGLRYLRWGGDGEAVQLEKW